jgi:hypothetical protein
MDGYRILAYAGESFDWERVLDQTRTRRLTLPVRTGLEFLRSEMGAPVPDRVLQSLRRAPVSLTERLSFNAQSVRPGPMQKMYRDLVDYALRVRRRPLGERMKGFIWYEQAVLKVGAWWHVPFRLAFLAGRNGRRALRSRLSKTEGASA